MHSLTQNWIRKKIMITRWPSLLIRSRICKIFAPNASGSSSKWYIVPKRQIWVQIWVMLPARWWQLGPVGCCLMQNSCTKAFRTHRALQRKTYRIPFWRPFIVASKKQQSVCQYNKKEATATTRGRAITASSPTNPTIESTQPLLILPFMLPWYSRRITLIHPVLWPLQVKAYCCWSSSPTLRPLLPLHYYILNRVSSHSGTEFVCHSQ